MTTTTTTVAVGRPRGQWLAPTGLILLALIPILAGGMRLTELTGNVVPTPANSRFLESPAPVIAHIVSVTVFSLLGALQFVPALRQPRARWHRGAGHIVISAGLAAAVSGMWMAAFYPHPAGDGPVLVGLRLLFGAAMIACIGLGIRSIIKREFISHSAWMTRSYAIGLGAGTQAIVLIPGAIIFGSTHELSRTILMGLAWVINLTFAELVIRRRTVQRIRSTTEMLS